MQQKSSKKTLIIIAIVIVLGGVSYFYFTGTPKDDTALSVVGSETDSEAAIVGSRVLALLNQITSLKIDTALFQSPMYTSLVDHTVPIYEQNVGKDNPFYYTPSKTK